MDPEEVWDFNPEEVPTVQQLLREAKAIQKAKKADAAKPAGTTPPTHTFQFFAKKGWHLG